MWTWHGSAVFSSSQDLKIVYLTAAACFEDNVSIL